MKKQEKAGKNKSVESLFHILLTFKETKLVEEFFKTVAIDVYTCGSIQSSLVFFFSSPSAFINISLFPE